MIIEPTRKTPDLRLVPMGEKAPTRIGYASTPPAIALICARDLLDAARENFEPRQTEWYAKELEIYLAKVEISLADLRSALRGVKS